MHTLAPEVELPHVLPSGPVEVVLRGDPGNRPSGTLSPVSGASLRAPAPSAIRDRCFKIDAERSNILTHQHLNSPASKLTGP